MNSYSDEDFLQIALEKNFLTQEHAQEALKLQKEMVGKEIGEILLSMKWIQESQYNVVRTFLRYKTRKLPQPGPMEKKWEMEKEHALSQKALKEGLITSEQLIECIFRQKEINCQGKDIPLWQVMIDKGYLLPGDLEYLEKGGTDPTGKCTLQTREKMDIEALDNIASFHFLAPVLVVLSEPSKNKVFLLSKKENLIGRARGANIQIEHNSISRIHCKLQYIEGQGWEIIDMMSTYGVFVHGNKVKKYLLHNRDKIQLGEVFLEIRGI